MSTCSTCTYFVPPSCANPGNLQPDSRMLVPPNPEAWACPYWLSVDVGLMNRLVSALGIVTESGETGDTYVLPDGTRFPRDRFRPWQDVAQAAFLLHLARSRGIFINYGPVQDASSDKWEIKEASGIVREATAQTAPRVIVETIVSRLENQPSTPAPTVAALPLPVEDTTL